MPKSTIQEYESVIMAGLTVVTAPSAIPITLAEAKTFLRIDTSDDDTLINTLIERQEIILRSILEEQQYKQHLNCH